MKDKRIFRGLAVRLLYSDIIKVSLLLLIIISSPVCFSATTHNKISLSALLRSDFNSSIGASINKSSTVTPEISSSFVPNLTNGRLQDIREYDRMKCFPRLLCTLTKSDAYKKLGDPINLNELADGYMKLLSAFPGGPPMDLFTQSDGLLSFKDDFLGNEEEGGEVGLHRFSSGEDQESSVADNESKSSASDSSEERKKKKQKTRNEEGNKEESEEMLLTDPLLHQKEKLEMKKLMDELIEEEKKPDGAEGSAASWTDSIPMKIGASLIKSVIIPYLIGDEGKRRKRDLFSQFRLGSKRIPKNSRRQEQTAIKVAMNLWNSLKSVRQCKTLYPSCPFEAWEVVSMISLISSKE